MRQLVRQERRTCVNCAVQGGDLEMNCFPIHASPNMFLNVCGLSPCLLASRAEEDDWPAVVPTARRGGVASECCLRPYPLLVLPLSLVIPPPSSPSLLLPSILKENWFMNSSNPMCPKSGSELICSLLLGQWTPLFKNVFYWHIVDLQSCVNFCSTAKWLSYTYVLCLVAQSCPTLCDPMDCSSPDSSLHGDSPG